MWAELNGGNQRNSTLDGSREVNWRSWGAEGIVRLPENHAKFVKPCSVLYQWRTSFTRSCTKQKTILKCTRRGDDKENWLAMLGPSVRICLIDNLNRKNKFKNLHISLKQGWQDRWLMNSRKSKTRFCEIIIAKNIRLPYNARLDQVSEVRSKIRRNRRRYPQGIWKPQVRRLRQWSRCLVFSCRAI